jgi:ATP-dependent Lon protease
MSMHPLVPVRDLIIFPGAITPIFVNRPKSVKALEEAGLRGGLIFIVAQKDPLINEPDPDEIYGVGTLCKVLRSVRLPDGTFKVMLEGAWRCRVEQFVTGDEFMEAELTRLTSYHMADEEQMEAIRRSVAGEFSEYVKMHPKIPDGAASPVENIEDPEVLSDAVASNALFKLSDKQAVLEIDDVYERLKKLLTILISENEYLRLEQDIHEQVRSKIDKGQRNYYLREQLKVIQEELDEGTEESEIEELRKKLDSAGMPEETHEKALNELKRYSKMPPISPEATVAKTYLEWLAELPWQKTSEDHIDLKAAKKILDRDHYGLTEIKERILEYLAVKKLAGDNMRSQVLCFVGPPGVGKTSLGRTIAETMGRKFVNMSLGGLRDEAEIRGHRRTYVGALPGRIIQKIKQAGTKNPVILMDEIDKIGSDFRGDPAAALLEVLDPEQNVNFTDNFIESAFDLSKVMFITTANSVTTIPKPLLDRMEMISIPGYVAEEKIKIAKMHLIPRIYKEHGLTKDDISIPESVIKRVINSYTMEAGVRELDRQLSKIARKVAAGIAENEGDGEKKKNSIKVKDLVRMLGSPKQMGTKLPNESCVGTAIGLAWTETGGTPLLIESAIMEGTGKVSYTGNLGDIMQESAQAALAYLRSNAALYGLTNFAWNKTDIHIHVPEGAVPKDGPSAGITLALAICSALTKRRVDTSYAMTGEMTLHGFVLPIGGVREKILAAKRFGVKKVIVPKDNREEIEELGDWVLSGVKLHYVEDIGSVFRLALLPEDREEKSE